MRERVGSAAEAGYDLAFYVDSLVVGIVHFGGVNAEAHEYDLRADLGRGPRGITAHDEVLLEALHLFLIFLVEHDRRGVDVDAVREHRHRLEPTAILATGLESDRLELSGHVVCGLVVLRRAGHAPLERIVGEKLQVSFDIPVVDDGQARCDGIL